MKLKMFKSWAEEFHVWHHLVLSGTLKYCMDEFLLAYQRNYFLDFLEEYTFFNEFKFLLRRSRYNLTNLKLRPNIHLLVSILKLIKKFIFKLFYLLYFKSIHNFIKILKIFKISKSKKNLSFYLKSINNIF